jgi:hypothetical protein
VRIVSMGVALLGLVFAATACVKAEPGTAVAASPTAATAGKKAGSTATSANSRSASPSAGAGTSSSDGAGTEKTIGTTVTASWSQGSAEFALESVTTITGPYGDLDEEPENGAFLILDVRVVGKSGTYPVNPLYFHLRSPDGQDVDAFDGNAMFVIPEPELDSEDVTAGQTITGKMVLDGNPVPGAKIVLTDPLDEPIGEWPL